VPDAVSVIAVDFAGPTPDNPAQAEREARMSLPFPPVSPEIVSVELFGVTLALRWYALAYIAGLMLAWAAVKRMLAAPRLWDASPPLTGEQLERLLTWVILGVILGGRLGFVLFYQPAYYLANPGHILRVWEGGMAFHGGFLGVLVAGLWFSRREAVPARTLGDLMAAVTPFGLFFGRIANFINAELWGRPTDLPWGVVFPGEAAQTCAGVIGACARHPSQLYEALLEGLLLGAVLLWAVWRADALRAPGRVMGMFLAGYGAARFVVEFVRQPDAQFVTPGNPLGLALQVGGYGLTMGQVLSVPMILAGLWFLSQARAAR